MSNLLDAAQTGDRLKTLIELRALLAERLETSKSDRDIASMSRRLMQCIQEIESLEKDKNAADEIGQLNRLRASFFSEGEKRRMHG